ncbi:Por secretion system C-terminal sorting domain-containing protein [Dyadobacter soli]|uniref:Por secretion system C-terminal sorting domain-containing protein n=1 Tax=Dyadobacter soli TaxID=659014 RepID=A0A1G8A8I9_9BACT|nr:T9SS type A sorting domain-containing protein [Dyadobacter soli]SDH17238.1 Por secretion system C-terminal sorting domain-containing protein [Dyadobacter soli]
MNKICTAVLISHICIHVCYSQVNTPNGVAVPPAALFAYQNAGFYTDAQLQSNQNAIQNGLYGPSCTILANYSRQYNCHGYAWHVSTGGAQTCIDQVTFGGVTPYIAGVNPSYTQTNYNSTVGKLRIRYSGDHSALTTYDGKFISKFGPGPLVKHNALDVPPGYGNPSTCWTCNYAPPLTSVYLDGKLISGSFQTTTWGAHNMQIFWGLDPDTGPTFSPTAGSTIISNQSSGAVNFTFNGPSNNGGLSIAFCGAPRYSFTFFKPNGAKMQVYPNPAREDEVITISSKSPEDIQAVNLNGRVNRITKIALLDERQRLVQNYLSNEDGDLTTVKLNAGLKGTYFLKATFEDRTVQTKRVLIEK